MPVSLVFQPLRDKNTETRGAFPEGGSNEAPAGPPDRLDWQYWAVLSLIGNYVTFSIIWLIFERGASVFILWCFFRHPYPPWHTKESHSTSDTGCNDLFVVPFPSRYYRSQFSSADLNSCDGKTQQLPHLPVNSFFLNSPWIQQGFTMFIPPSSMKDTRQGEGTTVIPLWRHWHQPVSRPVRRSITPLLMVAACIRAAFLELLLLGWVDFVVSSFEACLEPAAASPAHRVCSQTSDSTSFRMSCCMSPSMPLHTACWDVCFWCLYPQKVPVDVLHPFIFISFTLTPWDHGRSGASIDGFTPKVTS